MRYSIGKAAAAIVVLLAAAVRSEADITIGDFTFADDAFADGLLSATPNPGSAFRHEFLDPEGFGVLHVDLALPQDFPTLESLLVGADLHNWVGVLQSDATLTLGFVPPLPVDDTGPDLVLFDIGARESIDVTIGSETRTYAFEDTGEDIIAGMNSRDVNFAAIDLADFGVTSALSVTLQSVSGSSFDSDPTALGALNTGGATAVVDPSPRLRRSISLEQSAPNPFRNSTEISFTLPRDGDVDLTIHDISGRLVGVIITRTPMVSGRHTTEWQGVDGSGKPLAAGVYFYRLAANGESATRKVVRLD
jgi:hypothetical protein